MNYKNILATALLVCVVGVFSLLQTKPWKVYGDVNPSEATLSTSTPFLANNTVLCSGPGVLDSIVNVGVRTGQFWVVNASSTTHTHFATTTALLAILDAGFGTTTGAIKYGTDSNGVGSRGLVVSYTGTGTTTITYRCY